MNMMGKCWKDCAEISKHAGGIAVNISNIRRIGAYINSTQGKSNGIKVAKIFNEVARYANQGGKRNGSIALYLEPWHSDILYFLDLKKNTGAETERTRDLFFGLMVNDIFMKRVAAGEKWSLMCPSECDVAGKYGTEFEEAYLRCESEGKFTSQIEAKELFYKIMEIQIETGTPYIIYKDAANEKSNQKNIGVINGSNLCVSGDTMILTSSGYHAIKDLDGQIVEIWNGDEFSSSLVMKTGFKKKLLKITFNNGTVLKCTPNHKFYLKNKIRKDACELIVGDKLCDVIYPVIESGCLDSEVVPVNGTMGQKLEFLKEFIQLSEINENNCLIVSDTDFNYLNRVKLLMNTIGCSIFITQIGDRFVLSIDPITIKKLMILGLQDIKIDMIDSISDNYTLQISITSIQEYEHLEDTYCFNEPKKHTGIFNGVVAGNCAEILEVSTPYEYAVCFPEDTEITTKYGIRKIVDCNNAEVLCHFDNDSDLNEKIHFEKAVLIENGIKNVYKIMTNASHTIEATYDHPFLVYENNKHVWKKLSQIKRNDYLTTRLNDKLEYVQVSSVVFSGTKKVYDLALPNSHNFVANNFIVHNCNLASICLPKFVEYNENGPFVNYEKIKHVARVATRNLDNIIDINYYPVIETETSNLKHRPIGLGVQGLADLFILLRTPFDSELARDVNKKVFETIYFGTMTETVLLAKERGHYSTFKGSPFSEGKFQFDLWNLPKDQLSGMHDWDSLRQEMIKYGTRNSLTTTCMPTASTSQIMNNNECIEPFTENIYTRTTLAGDYYVVNKYLVEDLIKLNMWNTEMMDLIKFLKGSITKIEEIPQNIRDLYRTAFEINKKSIIEMAADRAPFIDQTQSMNIFISEPSYRLISNCLFYAWEKGLKTGIYYLRIKTASDADNFGIDIELKKKFEKKYGVQTKTTTVEPSFKNIDNLVCIRKKENGIVCYECSS